MISLNKGIDEMHKLKKFNVKANISEIIEALALDGCVVIEGLLEAQEADELQKHMTRLFDKTPSCDGDFYGHDTKRHGALFSKSKTFQKMAVLNPIVEIMDHFLLPGCSEYQVNLTQAISIGPNEIKQIMHQDDAMFPFSHVKHEAMLNCMWAIDDFTEDNGATILVPGSHLWPKNQDINMSYENLPPEMITKGVMKKGSVLIYLGSLFHSGGANRTDTRRCGVVISYCLGWLRQAENSYLAYSPKEVSLMPERLKRMLGYFVHEPNLGSVNGIDPYDYALKNKKDHVFEEFLPEAVQPLLREYTKQQKNAV